MKKSEIFTAILGKVCEVCEVSPEMVIEGSKLQNVVEARCLAVQYARRAGLSNDEIALIIARKKSGVPLACPDMKVLKKKSRTVGLIFNSYSERCLQSRAFRLMSVEIRDWCLATYNEMLEN